MTEINKHTEVFGLVQWATDERFLILWHYDSKGSVSNFWIFYSDLTRHLYNINLHFLQWECEETQKKKKLARMCGYSSWATVLQIATAAVTTTGEMTVAEQHPDARPQCNNYRLINRVVI